MAGSDSMKQIRNAQEEIMQAVDHQHQVIAPGGQYGEILDKPTDTMQRE